jgi:hypothetical protein
MNLPALKLPRREAGSWVLDPTANKGFFGNRKVPIVREKYKRQRGLRDMFDHRGRI